MKKVIIFNFLISLVIIANAQEVDYKKGLIKVDGMDYARIEVTKQNFGLTKAFEVFSISGEKLIIANVATEFEADKSDNSKLFYRLTFLTSNQIGIFKISAFSQEKSFANLIGKSGIIVNDKTDDNKVKEFIAMFGASPTIAVDYTIVSRNKSWPISINKDKTIEQNSKIIGSFRSTYSSATNDNYEFVLPSGVLIAKISFTGGNNAQNFELFTAKENIKRMVLIPQQEKIIIADASIDKNQFTLKRIAKWLVENNYL